MRGGVNAILVLGLDVDIHLFPDARTDLRTTTSQKCAAVPKRARIEGSKTFVSLNTKCESNRRTEGCRGRLRVEGLGFRIQG